MNSDHNDLSSQLINEQEQSGLVSADSPAELPTETNIGEISVNLDSINNSSFNATDGQSRLSCGVGTERSPCNSVDIMKSLIAADKKNNRHWIYGALITATVLILLSIGCFYWQSQPAVHKEITGFVLFMCGSIMVIVAFIALMICCIRCCASASTRNSNRYMTNYCSCFLVSSYTGSYTQMVDNILITIHLEDEMWRNQIDSIQNTVSTRITGCLTRKNYNGLKRRSCGHILIAKQGVIIDELIVIEYATNILLRLKLVNNIGQTGFILRLHFITRYYFKRAFCMDEPAEFHIDLFLPPYFQPQHILNIGHAIKYYSRMHG